MRLTHLLVGPTQSMARASVILLATVVAGSIGYWVLGGGAYSWIDALYMTVVTLTTVGYREIVPVEGPAAQIFTIAILIVGVGSFLYFFSNLTAFMVEGTLDRLFWQRRMKRRNARMSDHYVVCGGGRTGAHVLSELLATNREFVLIERDEDRVEELQRELGESLSIVIGDATRDAVLLEAGIERAKGMVSCISSDRDNLVVIFSARNIRPELRIVSRCTDEVESDKLRKAGADAVVHPDQIGGLRLVSELVRPTVVTFLDRMLRDGESLRVEEVFIAPGSDLAKTSVGQVRSLDIPDLMIVAVRSPGGGWTFNPPDDVAVIPGTGLVFMGTPQARAHIEKAAGTPS